MSTVVGQVAIKPSIKPLNLLVPRPHTYLVQGGLTRRAEANGLPRADAKRRTGPLFEGLCEGIRSALQGFLGKLNESFSNCIYNINK